MSLFTITGIDDYKIHVTKDDVEVAQNICCAPKSDFECTLECEELFLFLMQELNLSFPGNATSFLEMLLRHEIFSTD